MRKSSGALAGLGQVSSKSIDDLLFCVLMHFLFLFSSVLFTRIGYGMVWRVCFGLDTTCMHREYGAGFSESGSWGSLLLACLLATGALLCT